MMRKSDLASALAEKLEMRKADATEVVDTVFDIMKETLANGEDIDIRGFFRMYVTHTPEAKKIYSIGENKGKEYIVPEHTVPKIKFSKQIKELVYDVWC